MSARREPEPRRAEEHQSIIIRLMEPGDYQGFSDVVQSAWPGLYANAEHDFVALTDHGVSFAAFDNEGEMLGASLNMVRPSSNGKFHVLVHMLGVRREGQGHGVGQRLMSNVFTLVEGGQLGTSVDEVRLTSDPLELRNVTFYLRHSGMSVGEYKPDAYRNLAEGGGEQHRGLPADRFMYTAHPASRWIKERVMPSDETYLAASQRHPEAVLNFTRLVSANDLLVNLEEREQKGILPNFLLVQVPEDIGQVKARDMQDAVGWRQFHGIVFPYLFEHGYRAVDITHMINGLIPSHFIVLVRNFDDTNPHALINALR